MINNHSSLISFKKICEKMLKTFNVIVATLILFVIEAIIVYTIFAGDLIINHGFPLSRFHPLHEIFMSIHLRIFFGFAPQVMLYYKGLRYVVDKGTLKLSIFNVCVFVITTAIVLTILEGFYWIQDLKYFFSDFTAIQHYMIAAFLSPWILNRFTFFRKILKIAGSEPR